MADLENYKKDLKWKYQHGWVGILFNHVLLLNRFTGPRSTTVQN